ncbi:MAG: efflux RND transporter periplasmic adaptor subunit [Burkholderiales bacterium]|nr:efflux RND transporter periplasmic adaptor subunit [Burkholderiales bacterium]
MFSGRLGLGAGKPAGGMAQAATGAASAPPLEFRPAEVVQPVMAPMPQVVEFSGPLVAPNTAMVRSKAAGTLLALAVSEGQHVVAGQVLGRIDLAELSSRVAERAANLESARAALLQAERTHASNERLAQQSFISPIALDSSRAQLDTARATLNAASASLDTTRVGLREAQLVAPIAGIVAKRHAVPGEKVAVEQQLLTLVDLRSLELAGSVGTHEVGRLAPGMKVRVRVEGIDQPVEGALARIAPAAEAGTRSIGVTIALANPKETLRAGQYALARVELADPQQRLAVPIPAVGNTAGQDHVWLIENGALMRRAITLGRRDEAAGRVEVLTGLSANAQVLAARFDNLREGAKASVVAGKQPPVASAAASGATLR